MSEEELHINCALSLLTVLLPLIMYAWKHILQVLPFDTVTQPGELSAANYGRGTWKRER